MIFGYATIGSREVSLDHKRTRRHRFVMSDFRRNADMDDAAGPPGDIP
jgi:hypothetical protein